MTGNPQDSTPIRLEVNGEAREARDLDDVARDEVGEAVELHARPGGGLPPEDGALLAEDPERRERPGQHKGASM